MKKIFVILLIAISFQTTKASEATWMWYPGDYEIWLANKMQLERTERNTFFPPFWRMYSHYNLVDFYKILDLKNDEQIEIYVEGRYNVKVDGKFISGTPNKVVIPADAKDIHIKVFSLDKVPAVFVNGETIKSDTTWRITYEDLEWIDESGKASDISVTEWVKVGTWNFNKPTDLPSEFKLATKPKDAVSSTPEDEGYLVDFGEETFGFLKFHGLKGEGKIMVYYGESKEEALSTKHCETLDEIFIKSEDNELTLPTSKAFRYVYVVPETGVKYENISMLYEYLPLEEKGKFRCNDKLINKIWDISSYTMQLTSREFFIDGIKRDRWIWSGDAYQSYLMNYYLYFDNDMVERTLWAQRGKDPINTHINTIMDYTFYWFMGLYDYYLYSGNIKFVEQLYPRMVSLMDFCLGRRNENGMMTGLPGDWVYIDWAPLSKEGELSFEQILFTRSLEVMSQFSKILNDKDGEKIYLQEYSNLKNRLIDYFWDDNAKAIAHSKIDSKLSDNVTRYSNMFAIFFNYLDDTKKEQVKKSVLLNNDVQAITTPHMRFYELEALCQMGEHDFVMNEIRDYWGGMLNLGATSFWEKYDPTDSDAEHYAMYGRPFGKSLCHAWGASPIYLLGRYYLGVEPTSPGYEEYTIKPQLSDLKWVDGEVPTPFGAIKMKYDKNNIEILADGGKGTLLFKSDSKPLVKGAKIIDLGDKNYKLIIEKNRQYQVRYSQTK